MGCGASRPGDAVSGELKRRAGTAATANLAMVHGSRASYAGVPLLDMYRDVEEKLLKQAQDRNFDRKALNAKLREAQGAQGLQAKSVLLQVYSTQADVYEHFAAKSARYINMPTVCAAGPSNAIPCSLMLGTAAELEAEVEALGRCGGADGRSPVAPNTPLLGKHLTAVMKLKAMWGRKLLQVTLMVFTHPVLGRVALVQPLLLTACAQRLFAEGEELVTALLKGGASPLVRNSLNMTALLVVVAALAKRLEGALENPSTHDELDADVATAVAVTRLLLAAGADVRAEMLGFGRTWSGMSKREQEQALNYGSIASTRALLHLDRYTVREGYELMLRPLRERAEAASLGAAAHLDQLELLLRRGLAAALPSGAGAKGDGGGGGGGGLERRDSARQVAAAVQRVGGGGTGGGASVAAVNRGVTWPWVQAMSNITWAVSQVAMGSTPVARRAILRTLQDQAPFALPPMSVVSVAQLRKQGRIPRFYRSDSAKEMHGAAGEAATPEAAPTTTSATAQQPQQQQSLHFQPLQVDELPPGAVVVFVSHRWLGCGCPDDDKGTKLKQVYKIADHVARHRQVPVEQVYLWLDYSVVDQDNPMPGVQALPVYIACCDEFVYVYHEEYWERAWCLTEQFMHWKLGTGESKHRLDPASLALTSESRRTQPPDPTYGKLAAEADRIALAAMTSIMPYTLPGDESY
ncbi:hypothetical protein HYH02_006340 [Chlamydomonas schloesseri]|uniref:Uncharacterized protein n=1 Tax=Chlamydomonas schloesseri TaxID=2026947 RepID=A0A836B608_9CHLO|nr:hypothetical protein HYH02_006340 [Chlamydomonas schloesseri]|eukprot:KAG2448448.1 hypothetical protein HYH02_006340 [Chlamydomonas schloesseri]